MLSKRESDLIIWGVGTLVFCVIIICWIRCKCVVQSNRRRVAERPTGGRTAQPDQSNVYNISSRVQGQNHQAQCPDAFLSVEHITITNELNKPPKYDDAPPSYEEAVRIAMAQSNSIQTFQAEQSTQPPQSSSSGAPTTTVEAPAGVHRAS